MLVIDTPTTVQLTGFEGTRDVLNSSLTYTDQKANYAYRKAKKSPWLLNKLGEEGFAEHLQDLKAAIRKSLLLETDHGGLYTHSGLAGKIATQFNDEVRNLVFYPKPKLIPWANVPKKEARPYQTEALEKLIDARHGGVEIGTGLGKSFILMLLAKHYGLKTIVMTPSKSIAGQIYNEFVHHFGKKYVGKFFDGKKESQKLFVVAVDRSLTLVAKDSEHWNNLCVTKVFIADESHLCPASTLASVCFGLAASAPYRFFFSGTQLRNDGLDLLLEGITGPIVFEKTVREGVDEGWLAKPIFKMIRTESDVAFGSDDPNENTRAHLYYNPEVNRVAGQIASMAYKRLGPVLILVEEVEQISHLLPFLREQCGFAHGGLNKDNRDKVPQQFWDSDVDALVEQFNAGKLPILVGTSCISTGTDIKANKATIYLQGGKSEIQVRQGPIGRSTRLHDEKKDCIIYDFDVENIETLHRHANERAAIYSDTYDPPQYVSL